MSFIQLKNICKTFDRKTVLKGIDLSLDEGDNLAIVGESGCGKTTLAWILAGLLKADSGELSLPKGMRMVFQDPYSSLDPFYPIHAILNEAFEGQLLSQHERIKRSEEMLSAVGLSADFMNRYPHQLSGGERQRIAIARTLLSQGRVIILDEAVSALDVLIQKQILDLLRALKEKYQLTYIFISHNLRVVKNFSDKIAIMHDGRIIELGSTSEVFDNPKAAYTQELLKASLLKSI